MPYCVVCDTQFFHASFSGPAEDCDCGANLTRDALRRDYDEAEFQEMVDNWKRRQEGTDDDASDA